MSYKKVHAIVKKILSPKLLYKFEKIQNYYFKLTQLWEWIDSIVIFFL